MRSAPSGPESTTLIRPLASARSAPDSSRLDLQEREPASELRPHGLDGALESSGDFLWIQFLPEAQAYYDPIRVAQGANGMLDVAHQVDTEGTAILYVELGLGHTVLPAVQATALAKRSGLRALPIRGLPPMPLGWAARDFELLSSAADEFLALFDRAHAL